MKYLRGELLAIELNRFASSISTWGEELTGALIHAGELGCGVNAVRDKHGFIKFQIVEKAKETQ